MKTSQIDFATFRIFLYFTIGCYGMALVPPAESSVLRLWLSNKALLLLGILPAEKNVVFRRV